MNKLYNLKNIGEKKCGRGDPAAFSILPERTGWSIRRFICASGNNPGRFGRS